MTVNNAVSCTSLTSTGAISAPTWRYNGLEVNLLPNAMTINYDLRVRQLTASSVVSGLGVSTAGTVSAASVISTGVVSAPSLQVNSGDGDKLYLTPYSNSSRLTHTSGWTINYRAGLDDNATNGAHKFWTGSTPRLTVDHHGVSALGTVYAAKVMAPVFDFTSNTIHGGTYSKLVNDPYRVEMQVYMNNQLNRSFAVYHHDAVYYRGILQNISDDRIKSYEEPLTTATTQLTKLNPKRYKKHPSLILHEQNESPDLEGVHWRWENGFIAQELEAEPLLRHYVSQHPETGLRHVNYIELIPVLVQGFKELSAEVEQLKARLGS